MNNTPRVNHSLAAGALIEAEHAGVDAQAAMTVRMAAGVMEKISRGAGAIRDRITNARKPAVQALTGTGATVGRTNKLTATITEIEKTTRTIRGTVSQPRLRHAFGRQPLVPGAK